jgi:SAM-dependent methyltransferase
MKLDNRRSIADFDLIARPYRVLELLTFGPALQRCRTHFLPRLLDRRQALILGDGDGRFLAALLSANPHLVADAVDTSAAMLRLLQRRAATASAASRLQTHHTSAITFAPRHTYDLVVTHFFLDCLTQSELDALCHRLAPHLAPDALWLVSDFRIPTGPMRWPARALIRSLYLGFRLLTGLRTARLPDHAAALAAAGLTRIAHHHALADLLTTELWQFAPGSSSYTDSKPPLSREYTQPMLPPQRTVSGRSHPVDDPLPDPEPASPSLPGPDPGVFHRDPGNPQPAEPEDPPAKPAAPVP